jgi:hypothetical protein
MNDKCNGKDNNGKYVAASYLGNMSVEKETSYLERWMLEINMNMYQ